MHDISPSRDLDPGISIPGSQSGDLDPGISIWGSRPRLSKYIYIAICMIYGDSTPRGRPPT